MYVFINKLLPTISFISDSLAPQEPEFLILPRSLGSELASFHSPILLQNEGEELRDTRVDRLGGH